jgi:hypothetical protein
VGEITLAEFVKQEQARLIAFARDWRKNHAEEPENWPMAQGLGEWEEHYMMFDECEE